MKEPRILRSLILSLLYLALFSAFVVLLVKYQTIYAAIPLVLLVLLTYILDEESRAKDSLAAANEVLKKHTGRSLDE